MMALKTVLLAAGLALAGAGSAAAQTPAAPAATTTAPAGAAAVTSEGAKPTAPTTVNAPAAAAPTSPLLSMDGAPPMTAVPHVGQPTDGVFGLQTQVTPNGQRAEWMHDVVLVPLITAISVFVLILLIWVMFRYRRSANPTPSKTSHNTIIEIIWTVVPVLILVAIAVPSIGLLEAQFKPAPSNAVTLKAIGNQWYWSYEYPDNGDVQITANMLKEQGDPSLAKGAQFRTDADGPRLLAVDNRVVLPVGVPIRLITTSNDVIHSWAMPAFWIKLDAVPGRLNETSFTIEKPGLYFGQCSELCGPRHGFMPIAVEAVPPATFAAWIRAKGGTLKGDKPSTAAPAQPGADNSAAAMNEAAAADNTAGPVENTVAKPTTTSQPATANPAGAGGPGN